MTESYPEYFARFYDIIYSYHRDGVDNDFFQSKIAQTKGKILDIGVGTGRLFTSALNAGADIYGIDISRPMLNVLHEKIDVEDYFRISQQNIIDFSFDFRFDLIIAPFRVFMHLTDKTDQIKALNNIYSHLNDNGLFIFDTFVPDLKQLINGLDNVTDFEGEYEPGKKLRRVVSTDPDLINQVIMVNFKLFWDEDNEEHNFEWKIPLRFFFRYELEHLLERSFFSEYIISGDYEGYDLNRNSREFIVRCMR